MKLKSMPVRRARAVLAIMSCVAAMSIVAATSNAAPPAIEEKRAEAEQLYAELQAMDAELERAIDAYNGATYELDQIDAAIAENKHHLAIARQSYRAAQRNLEERLVALYTEGNPDVIEVILGAANLDDLLDRLDSAERVSQQDAQIVDSVRASRREIKRRERELARDRSQQRTVVDQRAAAQQAIEQQIDEREAYYEQVKDEIAQLVAEEQARQERAAREAREREEEERRLAAAAAAAGVNTSVVATPSSSSASGESAPPQIAVPEGIGVAPASTRGAQAAQLAMQYLGVPYVWGGASPSGFDCSGLVMYVYAQLGISLPHHAATMYGYGVPVSFGELAPGDLVYANGLGHMGMYIGGGNYIHAPQTGDVVKISAISSRSDWIGFKRVA